MTHYVARGLVLAEKWNIMFDVVITTRSANDQANALPGHWRFVP